MKKLLPILIVIVALVAGAGGGFFLRLSAPAKASDADAAAAEGETAAHAASKGEEAKADAGDKKEKAEKDSHGKKEKKGGHGEEKSGGAVYMKFSRQFVAPIVISGKPQAMMILDVNIEIDPDVGDSIYAEEPKLRDAVLKVLLRQGATGALGSIFADPAVLEETRAQILEEARAIIGDGARSILIMDVGYQKL